MTSDSGEHPDSAIARKAVSGAMWSTAAGLIARALSLVGTVLLVRFLAPSEYGEVQAASVLVLTASQFATLGVGAYIISFPKSGRAVAFHATFIHVGLGIMAMALVWVLRDQLGPLFEVPNVGRFIPGLIVSAVLDRLSFMAERPVVRDLGFRRVSVSRTLGEITYTVVSVYAAWRGHGAMSVVYGNAARSLVRLLSMLVISDWREWAMPCRLDVKVLKQIVPYGAVVSIESLAEFGARRWDNLVVTRLFGTGVAGQYVLAYNLADLPSIQIGEQIADVLLASYAHVDPERRPAAVVRAATLMALVMCPLSIGLGAVGPTIARAFFKPEWSLIGPFLMVLAMVLVVRPIGAVYSTYLMIVKGPKPLMYGEILAVALMMVLLLTVGRMGPLWICAMVGVAFAFRALFFMWYFQRTDGVTISSGLVRLLPIFLACVPMVAAVVGTRMGLLQAGIDRPVVSLILEIIAGGVAYTGCVVLLARDASEDFLGLVRKALRRRLAS
jgi:lipopolysaccharide exporter